MMFANVTPVRLSRKQKEDIQEILDLNKEKYSTTSHLIRVAIIKLIKEEQKKQQQRGVNKWN
jgi:Arc/MetJ-type ribon-helix-helix transcriptional regulator